MSWETKRPDRTVEYQDKFKNTFYIEIRHWENNSKEIAFTYDTDLDWGHRLEKSKWKEFVEILNKAERGEISAGMFNYESDGNHHQFVFRFVSRKDEYNAFKSHLLRFNSICSHPSAVSQLCRRIYPCDISFDIPLFVIRELIESLEADTLQTPDWQIEIRL